MKHKKLACVLAIFLGIFSHNTLAQNLIDGLIDTKNRGSSIGSCAGVADLYARTRASGQEASKAHEVSQSFQQQMNGLNGQDRFDANSARSAASGANVSGQQVNAAYQRCLRLL